MLINLLRKGDQRLSRWLEFQVSLWLVCCLLPTLLAALDTARGFFVMFFFARVFRRDKRERSPRRLPHPSPRTFPPPRSQAVSDCPIALPDLAGAVEDARLSFPRSHLLRYVNAAN